MPRRFKRNWTTTLPPVKSAYLEHPVGSNEWHRQKTIEIAKREIAKREAKREEEKAKKN